MHINKQEVDRSNSEREKNNGGINKNIRMKTLFNQFVESKSLEI